MNRWGARLLELAAKREAVGPSLAASELRRLADVVTDARLFASTLWSAGLTPDEVDAECARVLCGPRRDLAPTRFPDKAGERVPRLLWQVEPGDVYRAWFEGIALFAAGPPGRINAWVAWYINETRYERHHATSSDTVREAQVIAEGLAAGVLLDHAQRSAAALGVLWTAEICANCGGAGSASGQP